MALLPRDNTHSRTFSYWVLVKSTVTEYEHFLRRGLAGLIGFRENPGIGVRSRGYLPVDEVNPGQSGPGQGCPWQFFSCSHSVEYITSVYHWMRYRAEISVLGVIFTVVYLQKSRRYAVYYREHHGAANQYAVHPDVHAKHIGCR